MTRVVVLLDNETEVFVEGSPQAPDTLAAHVSEALSAPGSVLTLHARNRTHVIPVRAVRHVYVEPEEPS